MIIEIILFTVSVVVLNILLSNKNWTGVWISAAIIILIEIFLKKQGYNILLKLARQREIKNDEIESQGITNLYFMRKAASKNRRNQEIANAIDESNELFLLAETGKSYIDPTTDRHWKNIKQKIDSGIKFKILLICPFSHNKIIRNKLNKVESDRKFDFDVVTNLANHNNVTIKFTNEIYCTLFFTEKYMIYDPYHLGRIGDRIENNFIALEFKNGNENYNILKSHFENCWENSIGIEELKAKYEKTNSNL